MSLVVSVDPGLGQEQMALLAGRLAARAGQDLLLVHVISDPWGGELPATQNLWAESQARLTELAATVAQRTGARVESGLWAGSRPSGLALAAESVLASALLVPDAEHGRGRWLAGLVEGTVRKARVPVLALRQPTRLDAWVEGRRPLRVLVGSHTGPSASRALRFAQQLSQLGPIELTVLSVAEPARLSQRYGLAPPPDDRHLLPEAEAALRRDLAAQVARAGLSSVDLAIRAGAASPAAHLAMQAEELDIDLVVVGTRRASWLEEAWYGSVSFEVLRGVGTNVACVPRGLVEDRAPPLPPPRVMLVATDLTAAGDAALPVAFGYVAPGGQVHLVHVLDTEPVAVPGHRLPRDDIGNQLRARIPAEAGQRAVQTHVHVVGGETTEAIVALAERVGADAICVAAVTTSTLGAVAFGSVSRSLLTRARCPVIVVPGPRE